VAPNRARRCHSNSPSGGRHFELRCQRNGANGLAVASRLAPSSEQANFSSADIVSLIGKCLTPETGEVFLPNTKKLLVEERSGFSTRGMLKFRQNTIFWRDIFLSPMQDHKQLREF
jgi:hypothetical protein